MHKHAYLILAHEDTLELRRLLALIDDERHDIYIHIDKKSRAIREEDLFQCVKKIKGIREQKI